MNDVQINVFLTVARTRSFTAASQKLFVSQPAVSKQIVSLEKEIGARLFHRGVKETTLTEVGEIFFQFFTEVEKGYKQVKYIAQQITENIPLHLDFGIVEDWDITSMIYKTISLIKEKFPQMEVRLRSYNTVQIADELLNGKADLILYSPMFLDEYILKELEEYFIINSRLIVLFSANNALREKKDLQLKDFENEPLYLCLKEENAVISKIKYLCWLNGFVPRIEKCDKREDLMLQLQTGNGYSFFHEMVHCKSDPVYSYFIPDTSNINNFRQEICLYHLKDNKNPALRIFLEEISRVLKQPT